MEDSLSSISIPVPRSPPGENPGTLFIEDEVCLRTNMAVTGIVMRTWHDVDAPRYRMDTGQAIFDSSTTIATRHQFLHQGQPPRGHVVVQFGDQSIALQLRPESQLILLDRAFQFGDIVKKSATEEMSGTVIRIGITCDIRPSCVSSTPLGSSSSRLDLYDIPGEELTLNGDFQEGDFVIFKDWVGVVEDLEEEVTLRLSDGGVVVLEDSLEVEIPLDPTSPIESSSIESEDGSRAHNGRARGQRYAASVAAPNNGHQTLAKSAPVDRLSEGQYVTTKKWNLRRGRWKYGSYNPNTSPQGFVVEVHPIFLWVRWLCSNVMTPGHTPSFTRPDERLEPSDFERSDFRRYDLGRVPRRTTTTKSSADESEDELSPLGGLRGACLQTGDYVRFCDLAGALVKYGGHGQTRDGRPQGTLTKIDRADMQGYDLNTFIITRTSSRVGVMWQDLSESDKPSTSLIPYLNIDELDVWPGELVTTKLSEVSSDGLNERKYSPTGNVCNGVGQQQHPLPSISRTILSRPLESGSILPDGQLAPGSRLGITQAVNARDRVAGVRWFANPQIAFTSEMPPQVLPGSLLGPLRHEVQQTSVYEMHAHQSLMKRRGDFVVIAGKTPVHVDDVDWFGEVVDIRLDGSISVRLAAAKECRDVNLPTEQVTVVYGDDDDQSYSGDDESDSTDDDNSSGSGEGRQYPYNDGREVLETIEYEGGDRIMSDGGEEMWSTDDEAVSIAPLDTEFAMEDAPDMTDDEGLEGLASRYSTPPEHSQIESNTTPRNRVRARISSPGQILPHMGDAPQNFAVLECSPPLDHAFIDRIGGGSRNSRLAREYRILEEGLPEGNIWVRTWESRFNIARVLILGPRGTPYSLAPFVMDFHFGTGFPEEPPEAYFHSWTNGYGRINPNLYEDGKVCLSLLGTWPADAKNEGWSSKSTFLQVLVSLMGLVLVKEPYYNEAGYDILIDSPATAVSSTHYTERAYTIGRAFVRHALTSSVDGINDVIRWLYLPSIPGGLSLLKEVVAHSKLVLERSTPTYNQVELPTDGEECKESGGVRTISAGAAQLLRRHVTALEDLLASDLAKSNPSSSHATSQELPSVQ